MLKRLLTAVLILTMFMVFTGTAFSAPGNVPLHKLEKQEAPGHAVANARLLPAMSQPHVGRTPVMSLDNTPVTPLPTPIVNGTDTNACYYQDIFTPFVGAGPFRIDMYDPTGPFLLEGMSTRMKVFNAPTHTAVVDTAFGIIRFASHLGGAGCKVEMNLWSDLGGMPNTILYSVVYTLPKVTGATWFKFPLPVAQTITGGAYHVGFRVPSTQVLGDSLSFRINGVYPSAISNYEAGASVFTMTAVFGAEYIMAAYTHHCEHYHSCYTNNPIPAPGYVWFWDTPGTGWGDGSTNKGFAQRFVTGGKETLKTVQVIHYDFSGSYPGLLYSGSSTNGFKVSILKDNGAGQVDTVAGALATVIVPGGVSLFPNTGLAADGFNTLNVDFSAFNLVLLGAYHVAVEVTSNNPADGILELPITYEVAGPFYTDGTGASVSYTAPGKKWQRTGTSTPWLTDPLGSGVEEAYLVRPILCKDEFSVCQTQKTYGPSGPFYAISFDGANAMNVTQRIKGTDVNRIDAIRFYTSRRTAVVASFKMDVYSDTGATLQGPLLATYTVPRTPGLTQLVIPGGLVVHNNFWVGYHPVTMPPTPDTLRAVTDDGTAFVFGGARIQYTVDGLWYDGEGFFGPGYKLNLIAEVDFCSLPPTEWLCGPVNDYPTANHDFARTGHSNTPLSDAYCDLTFSWKYVDAAFGTTTGAMSTAAPILFGNYVVGEFGTHYVILDRLTGALLKTFTGAGAPDFITGTGGLNVTPTIASVVISGTPTNVLFIGGGSTASISAYNMDVAGFPQIWSINGGTLVPLGYPGALGNTAFVNFVKMTIAGTDYLYFATAGPRLYAANAATGARIWGPVTLDGPPLRGMASDGTNIYLTTTAIIPSNPEGDVYKVNATTGAVLWQLSTSGGLKGQTVFGVAACANESFPNGLSVDNGEVYTVSGFVTLNTFPADGLFYRIAAATGAVLSTAPGSCIFQGGGTISQGQVILDAAIAISPGTSAWTTPPLGGKLIAYSRVSGNLVYATNSGDSPPGTFYSMFADAAMSCETGAPDYLIATNGNGYASFFLDGDGSERFNRRWDFPPTNLRGAGVAIGKDTSVVIGAYFGQLYRLTKQADRPRLEIVNYSPTATTYGPLASVLINFGKVYTNTGCGVLSGSIQIDNTSNGSTLGVSSLGNDNSVFSKAASIADQLTNNSAAAITKAQKNIEELIPTNVDNRMINRAAAALPPFINPASLTIPFSLSPGDSANLILDVKQNAVNRGPNVCWGWFTSNDPDFFLNDLTRKPQIKITIIGGCVTDTTALKFGAGSANYEWVTNNGRLGTGDWSAHAFSVEGNVADFYQGTYVYGVTKQRIAMNSQDWSAGGGEANAWISLQGDPNLCNNDCKPNLLTSVSLGAVSLTGLGAYTPLIGNLVCRSYIDSVQNFGPPAFATWNWRNFTANFDADSTMGLKVDSRVFAVVSAPAGFTDLNNVTVDEMKIYPRYNVPLNNWKMGEMIDYDIGGDSAAYNAGISAAWSFATSKTTGAWGAIKLPFGGCGATVYAPMKNVKALNADQAQFATTAAVRGSAYWDSCYAFMSLGSGAFTQGAVSAGSDQEFHATIAEHNFTGNTDTLRIAVAQFAFPSIANPKLAATFTPVAHLLNKWVGFDRGDVNNDGILNLADIVYLAKYLNIGGSAGPIPFVHVGDVNADGLVNAGDVTYLEDYYFHYGPCPVGKFITY